MDFKPPILHHVTDFVIHVFILALVCNQVSPSIIDMKSSKELPIPPDVEVNRICGGELEALTSVQAIDIPKLNDSSKWIYCEWTIRSCNPMLKIGIVPVDHFYAFYENKSFIIDIYDGPSAESPVLLYWHGRKPYVQHFSEAKTSMGSVIFVNYTAPGGELHLDVKLLYYLCGGRIRSDMYIRSPVFNTSSSFEVPLFLECTWSFEKPSGVLFGHIHFSSVKLPYCGALSVKSSKGILVTVLRSNTTGLEYIDPQGSFFFRERNDLLQTHYPPETKAATSLQKSAVSSESKPPSNKSIDVVREMSICNSSIKGIAFNGSSINLTFAIFYPESIFGVQARFSFLRPLKLPRQNINDDRHWFRNYAAIVLFLPIGIVIGLLIICIQMQSWKLVYNTPSVESKSKSAVCSRKRKPFSLQEMPLVSAKDDDANQELFQQDQDASADRAGDSPLQDDSRFSTNCNRSPEVVTDVVIHRGSENSDETIAPTEQTDFPTTSEKLRLKKVTFMIGD